MAVVTAAYVRGATTRRVEALVRSFGIVGLSTSEVRRLGAPGRDAARRLVAGSAGTRRLEADDGQGGPTGRRRRGGWRHAR